MSSFDVSLPANPAVAFVSAAQDRFSALGLSTFNLAVQQTNSLANFGLSPTNFNVNFDFAGQITPFNRPNTPVIDFTAFDIRQTPDPGSLRTFDSQPPDIGTAPVFTTPSPTLAFGSQPALPNIVTPTAPPASAPLVVPAAPAYVLPALPTLAQLNLPTLAAINLPLFAGVRPNFVEPPLNENWSFTPSTYVDALMDKITATVSTMLDGQRALPLAIERGIFDAGRTRIMAETQSDVSQTIDEWGARGFAEPPGMLKARVESARQKGQDLLADLNRDVTVKAYEEALVNYRLAVDKGITLEGVKTGLFIEQQKLLLQSAQFLRETSIAILNARLSVFNTKMQLYQTDAQVLNDLIRAELSKLEIYKAQIEGQKLVNEVNSQRVQQYSEQVRGVIALAEFYRTQVEGVKVQADVQRLQFESFRTQVDAYSAQWGAYGQQINGYRAGVEAEGTKAQAFNSLVNAFGSRIQAYSTEQGAKIERERLRVQEHQQDVNVYVANLQRIDSLIGLERARLAAVGAKADAQARIYTAQASVEQSATAASDRSFELGLAKARANVDTQLEVAKIHSTENVAIGGLQLEIRKALAQILAQLAASSMAAVSYSAGVSSGMSESLGHSKSFGYSGSTPDASPTY